MEPERFSKFRHKAVHELMDLNELCEDVVVRDGLTDRGIGLGHSAAIVGCVAEPSQRTLHG